MKPELFSMTQHQIFMLAGLAADLELEEFLSAIDRADAFGPILDPTLWRAGHKKMELVREAAEAIAPLVRWARRQRAAVLVAQAEAEKAALETVGAPRG